MDDQQLLRYSRHYLLPSWQESTQRSLQESTVLLIGLGGLGSAAALYLAAAGVGTLILADPDVVELSNLQRQIIHDSEHIGMSKVASAAARIQALNPEVHTVLLQRTMDRQALDALTVRPQLVLDGSDNFATRYMVNAFCMEHALPLISGAAIGWIGQLAVFDSRMVNAPCYQCIYPNNPVENDSAESCHRSGVIGPLVGVVGSMMALEAIKVLGGLERPFVHRFLVYDSATGALRMLKTHQDPLCPVCAARKAHQCALDSGV